MNKGRISKDDIILMGGAKDIAFCRNIPNENIVLEFIDQIIKASKTYIRKKYIVFDDIDEEEFIK